MNRVAANRIVRSGDDDSLGVERHDVRAGASGRRGAKERPAAAEPRADGVRNGKSAGRVGPEEVSLDDRVVAHRQLEAGVTAGEEIAGPRGRAADLDAARKIDLEAALVPKGLGAGRIGSEAVSLNHGVVAGLKHDSRADGGRGDYVALSRGAASEDEAAGVLARDAGAGRERRGSRHIHAEVVAPDRPRRAERDLDPVP